MAEVEKWLRINDRPLISTPSSGYPGVNALRLGVTPPSCPPELNLYELYVPIMASNWTVFRGLMHKDALALVTSQRFVMRSEANTSPPVADKGVYVNLSMLPPQPLTGVNGASDLYLITLVDGRYFGGSVRSSLITPFITDLTVNAWGNYLSYTIPDATDDFFANEFLITQDGVTGVFPSTVYGRPEIDSDLFGQFTDAGVLTDAALNSCGLVLVADVRPGTGAVPGSSRQYATLKWSAANTFAQAARAASEREAGGVMYTTHPAAPFLPSSVTTTFPDWCDGLGYVNPFKFGPNLRPHGGSGTYGSQYFINVTSTSLGSPYSSLPIKVSDNYYQGFVINSTAKAVYDTLPFSGQVPANFSALQQLAIQLAKDFYDSNSTAVSETYRGIIQFDPRAGLNVIYSYWPTPMTRVFRRPLNDSAEEMFHNLDSPGGSGMQINRWKGENWAPVKVTSTGGSFGAYVGYRMFDNDLDPTLWPQKEAVNITCANHETLIIGQMYWARQSNLNPATGNSWIVVHPALSGILPVAQGGTGQSTLTSGQLLAGNGTGPVDSLANTRVSGESLELLLASDRWIAFSKGSF